MTEQVIDTATLRLANQIFRTLRQTLINRRLYYQRKDGSLREVEWVGWAPWFDKRAFAFVLNTGTLPVPIEQLCDDRVVHQISAALGGRRVKVVNNRGVVWLIGMDLPLPDEQERRELPQRIDLDLGNRPAGGPYLIPIGEGHTGPVWRTLAQLDSVLVGGTRRMGKSTWLNATLAALLTAHSPEELKVALIDPKVVELSWWRHVPHLIGHVATNAVEAEGLLDMILGELEIRQKLFAQINARNLNAYNQCADNHLPAILVVVDEVIDLVIEAGGPKAEMFKRLIGIVSKGGAFGIHTILATQRPDVEVVAGILKANLATRLSFWLPSSVDYRLTLAPHPGQNLPTLPKIPGRLLARLDDSYHVLQGYYLDDEQIMAIVRQLSDNMSPKVLSPEEVELATWAIEANDGYLGIENIASLLGVTAWQARRLAARWERYGWLEKDRCVGNKRKVTSTLRAILNEDEGGKNESTG